MSDSYGHSKSMNKRLLLTGKVPTADDLQKIIITSFEDRLRRVPFAPSERAVASALVTVANAVLLETLDETMPWFEAYVDAVKKMVMNEGMTVVKLRDDEASPVAAPCAIAGACQYGSWEPEMK